MNADFFCVTDVSRRRRIRCLTLYDHGGVTAFDAAGGRGDGAGDVAGGQEHRETDSQGSQKGQQDLFYILLHSGSFLVVAIVYI